MNCVEWKSEDVTFRMEWILVCSSDTHLSSQYRCTCIVFVLGACFLLRWKDVQSVYVNVQLTYTSRVYLYILIIYGWWLISVSFNVFHRSVRWSIPCFTVQAKKAIVRSNERTFCANMYEWLLLPCFLSWVGFLRSRIEGALWNRTHLNFVRWLMITMVIFYVIE